jgi:hypothetical protein
MVIQPGDTTTLDNLDMILSFFRWTAFSADAFEMFLHITTSYVDAAALSIRLLHWTQPKVRRPLRFPLKQAVSVHQNLQEPKTDGCVFWDQNLCIVCDAHSPMSLTGIDKIQHLSSICIHVILLRFIIHQAGHDSK